MKIDLKACSYEGRWFDFEDCRLKVRPCPESMADVVVQDGALVVAGNRQAKIFCYCLEDWEKVADADGKPIVCTDEVKKKIFDFDLGGGMVAFVLQKARELKLGREALEKN